MKSGNASIGLVISTFDKLTQSGAHQQVLHFYSVFNNAGVDVRIHIYPGLDIKNTRTNSKNDPLEGGCKINNYERCRCSIRKNAV